MKPTDSPLKSFATTLAAALTEKEGREAVDLMEKLGVFPGQDGAPAPASRPGWIGIWEPRAEDGRTRFERSRERADEWSLWADVPVIPPKGPRKRVVLLGESVARGYFYDPEYTPAQILEGLLDSAGMPGGAEVVDLAKTDLSSQGLGELLSAALALQPDAFVIFAGNNWAQAPSVFPQGLERHLAATILRDRGVAELKAYFEEKIVSEVEAQVRGGLGPLSMRVPVVLLVPEFNLADWFLDGEADAPWLPDGLNARWLECREAARAALADGRLDAAEVHAREMVEIDGGTAATGLTILAECRRRRGLATEARRFLERARDSHLWDSAPQVPKSLSVIQETLRKSAGQGRIAVVDLPRLLEESLGGELPDRRAFLDYCHMSSWGLRMAMAATAEQLLPLLGGRGEPREELFARTAEPAPQVEAQAHFTAAIHNAHWGQPYSLIHDHCNEALRLWPGIAEAMQAFLDLQVRQAPAWACSSLERLAALGSGSLLRYVSSNDQGKLFDAILLDAIADSLEKAGFTDGRERLEALRQAERGVAQGRSVDYLAPYYHSSWADRSRLWWSSFFYRAYDRISRFPLVCSDPSLPVDIELTWRSPAAGQEGETGPEGAVLVNGRPVASLSPEDGWKTQRFTIRPELLRQGVNALEIHWPVALGPGSEGIEQAAQDVEQGRPYLLLPVFAEAHSFRASLASGKILRGRSLEVDAAPARH